MGGESFLFPGKGVPPPPTPGRRSALHPGSFSLHAQRKGTKRNAPRRLPRDFSPEADPTPGPQRPTGRIGQGQPRYRRKIVLKTPQWGGERPNPKKKPKISALNPDTLYPERVFVGVGSNVGGRLVFLRRAVRALAETPGVRVIRASRVYETSPVGPRQRDFLNAVIELRSSMGPEELLRRMKDIESVLGRRRRRRWGPREIDLDLLFFGQRRCRGALQLPHPRWAERKFVVWPLADLAPRFKDISRGRTVAHFRQKLTDPDQSIRLYPKTLL